MADKFEKQKRDKGKGIFNNLVSKATKSKTHSDYVQLEGGDDFNTHLQQQQDIAFENQTQRQKKKNKQKGAQQTCCLCFSIKTGFYIMGIIDVIMLPVIAVLLFTGLFYPASLAIFIFHLPNVVLFFLIVAQDDGLSRKIYANVLFLKGFMQAFAMPFILMKIYEDNLSPKCPEIVAVWNAYLKEHDLVKEAMEMCNETMINTIIVTYMIFQVLVGYQCYNARNFMKDKILQEQAQSTKKELEEAQERAKKKGDIIQIKDELDRLKTRLMQKKLEQKEKQMSRPTINLEHEQSEVVDSIHQNPYSIN